MKLLLIILVAAAALTATFSGIMIMVKPDGSLLALRPAMLTTTPFKSFLLPGLLFTVAGLAHIVAFVHLMRGSNRQFNLALTAGIVLLLWISVQLLMLQEIHWLHLLYLGAAALIVLISYQLKGKWAV